MSDATARLALPFIAPGQAQKELAHNEALLRIDLALHASVEAMGLNDPPASPAPGQCWIVGAAPAGDWAGQALALAGWTGGGWRFVAPVPGMTAWIPATGLVARFDGTAWAGGVLAGSRVMIGGVQVIGARQPAIVPPDGGAVVDGEARAAVSAILGALSAHGLIAS